MTHKLDADDFFILCMQRFCAEAGLSFFLIEPLWVEAFLEMLQQGTVWPRVLLNMHSEHHQPEEVYHRLVRLAGERHSLVIDPLERALAAFDKSRLHARLLEAGIPVPFSIITTAQPSADWRLSDEERAALGSPFVIKPGMGYGRRGVVMDATGEADLARAVASWPDKHYLLQRLIVLRRQHGVPLYWRVYFVFGMVWLSWWNCDNDNYRLVTAEERETFGLGALEEIVRRIAALTGMTFFSSEMGQTESGDFIVIDYVNDQCHLLSQTANPQIGVPNVLIEAMARRLVEGAQSMIANPAGHGISGLAPVP